MNLSIFCQVANESKSIYEINMNDNTSYLFKYSFRDCKKQCIFFFILNNFLLEQNNRTKMTVFELTS